MKRSRTLFFLFVIIVLACTVRFVGLASNPAGLVDDEQDAAYDAYSLLHTGADQWGEKWPLVSFRGFGDYRLPAYTYLAIAPIHMFGLNAFAIRFPAALFGTLSVLVVYFLAAQLFVKKNSTVALFAAFFLAISPWHIAMSRVGIEHTASVFFVSSGILCLLYGRKSLLFLVLSGIAFGVSLFIYRPNIILTPAVLLVVVFLYRQDFKKVTHLWLVFVVGLVVALPILLSVGRQTFINRLEQVNFIEDTGFVNAINERRGACNSLLPDFVCQVYINKYSVYAGTIIKNYYYHFSADLLFNKGTETQFFVLPERGLLYLTDALLLIVAAVLLWVQKSKGAMFLFIMMLVSAIPDALTSAGHYARYFISFPTWPMLCAFATIVFTKKRNMILSLLVAVYLVSFSNFILDYWTFFPYQYSSFSHFGYKELVERINENTNKYERIIVSSRINDSKQYIKYLFYTAYDPRLFQSGEKVEKRIEANGWVRVSKIKNIEFVDALPSEKELENSSALLIGSLKEFPGKLPEVFSVQDIKGDVLFVGIDSKILYP